MTKRERKYCNIKDFDSKDFDILKQIGFSTVSGGVLVFNKQKILIDKITDINNQFELLRKWISIKNSSNSNLDHSNKYQVFVWIKLIKRTDNISVKQLMAIFKALNLIQTNKEYRNKFADLFIERIKETSLSEDWKDRFIRTVK